MAAADVITATLNYTAYPSDGTKPYSGVDEKTGERITNISPLPKQVHIENVRGKEAQYDLNIDGFMFVKHKSVVTDFSSDEEVEKLYYPESIEVYKKFIADASRVVIFDHTIRRHCPGVEDAPGSRQPALRVHVDQTPESAANRVKRHVPELAEELLEHRYQIINLWRPISHPAMESPLAVCDYRSIDLEKDLVPTDLRYPNQKREIFTVNYNPAHKWKYLKGMTPEEAILFKCSDSSADGSVARFTPHTAFEDPTTPADAPLRESIELRALVYYDE